MQARRHEYPPSSARYSWWPDPPIPRESALQALKEALSRSPIVVLVGPRQSGKTTLARTLLDEGSADAPRVTASIRIALEDLGLEQVLVLYPGTKRFPIAERVEAVPLQAIAAEGALFLA